MHDVLRTKVLRLLFTLSCVKTKHIDKHRSGKKALCRSNNKRFAQQPTSFDNYKEVLSKLGYSVTLDFDSIIPVDQHVAKDVNSIGIAPFAAHKGKIYPLEKMSEVIRLLIAKGKKIYLLVEEKLKWKLSIIGKIHSEMITLLLSEILSRKIYLLRFD